MRKTVLAAAAAFLAAVLLTNTGLFRTPIFEHTDYALNSLQVREAKAFHELLGNYSRWGFHHPGPAVFYLMALGEWLFYDATRLVPAPMNAQILTLILFNIVLISATVRILPVPSPAFAPLALAAVALVAATINHALAGSAPVSAWMPHVALFPFLFFLAICASVAAGEIRRLPVLAASGMLLVHLHVAQCLFVVVLGGAACVSCFRRRGAAPWRRPAFAAAAVVGVFLMPILLEIALYKPNNLDAVLAYTRQHTGAQKSLGEAVWYFGTFLAYLPSPETAQPGFDSLWASFVQPYVALYWLAFATAAVLAALAWRRGKTLPPFLGFAALASAAASALFLFWATRIAGELYNFNGYFIYSAQLMLWLILAAIVAQAIPRRAVAAAWAVALLLLAVWSPRFKIAYSGLPQLPAIAAGIPRMGPGQLRLDFPHGEWANAAGIGIQLARQGKPFCVAPQWEFAFGRPNTCPDSLTQTRLIFEQPGPSVVLRPPVLCRLPVEFEAADGADLKENFHPLEQGRRWTLRTGAIRFVLARDFNDRPAVRIRVVGSTVPGRPARLLLNGRAVGSIDHIWNSAAEFVVGRDWFRPGEENRLVFEIPNAGPVDLDYRELGLRFERLRMEAVE